MHTYDQRDSLLVPSSDFAVDELEVDSLVELSSEWFLGFDGLCQTCADLAAKVSEISDGRLSAISLNDPMVRSWRSRSLGDDSPWVPTLFRVRGEDVEAWTGPRLVTRLARLIGPKRAWSLAEELGQYGREPRFGRRKAITGLAGVATGLLLVSKAEQSAEALSTYECRDYFGGVTLQTIPLVIWWTIASGTYCRQCPTTASPWAATVGGSVKFREYTTLGAPVSGNPSWWRTSGSIGCWVSDTRRLD